jgi:hypothetical protein
MRLRDEARHRLLDRRVELQVWIAGRAEPATNADGTGNGKAIVVIVIDPAVQAEMAKWVTGSGMPSASVTLTSATVIATATARGSAGTVIVIAKAATTVNGEATASVRIMQRRIALIGTGIGNANGGVGPMVVLTEIVANVQHHRNKIKSAVIATPTAALGQPFGLAARMLPPPMM